MNDFDSREEIYRRQDREEEAGRVTKPITDRDPQDIITMRVSTSCAHGEAIQSLVTFCLENKDRWEGSEDEFRRLSWSVDKVKEFLNEAVNTFAANDEGPQITSVEWD
jgi:hypothetical protein